VKEAAIGKEHLFDGAPSPERLVHVDELGRLIFCPELRGDGRIVWALWIRRSRVCSWWQQVRLRRGWSSFSAFSACSADHFSV
jgi:hypothetical protein